MAAVRGLLQDGGAHQRQQPATLVEGQRHTVRVDVVDDELHVGEAPGHRFLGLN